MPTSIEPSRHAGMESCMAWMLMLAAREKWLGKETKRRPVSPAASIVGVAQRDWDVDLRASMELFGYEKSAGRDFSR